MQAKNTAQIKYRLQLWRLVTPIFLHAGFIHLVTNLLMQLRVGVYVEQIFGWRRFTVLYLASGIYASVMSAALKPDQISVGASGALMGVMGAWTVHLLLHWGDGHEGHQSQRGVQLILAVVTIGVILGMSFVPSIDWSAHLGGLVGGIFLGLPLLAGGAAAAATSKRRTLAIQLIGAVLFLGTLAAGFAAIFTVVESPKELLAFCTDVVKPSFPTYNLQCYGN